MRQGESGCHLTLPLSGTTRSLHKAMFFHLHLLGGVTAASPRKIHHLALLNSFNEVKKEMFSSITIRDIFL